MKFNWEVLADTGFTMGGAQRGPHIDLSEVKTFTDVDASALFGKKLALNDADTSTVTDDNWAFFYLSSSHDKQD